MLDSFFLRSGSEELAKAIHSLSGAVTTIFLFTRIWARTSLYKGLWWDDYILIASWALLLCGNGLAAAAPSYGFRVIEGTSHGWLLAFSSISLFYIAMALSKTAFAVTLIRLSSGRTRVILWIVVLLVCAVNIAAAVITWLDLCDARADVRGISGFCVAMQTAVWIHVANAIVTLLADAYLAYLPWRVLAKIYIPSKEKWGVGITMSLVGLAGIVCLVRTVLASHSPKATEELGTPDWTYGWVALVGLFQAEVGIYIVAQAIPLLRVFYLGQTNRSSRSSGSIREAATPSFVGKKMTTRVTGGETIHEADESIELVQLPSGRIVQANSEEGKAFRASRPAQSADVPETQAQQASGFNMDDEVHRVWADMGLSRRAWSQSPSPPPAAREVQHLG
ncbi:hypothetical protein J7T55_003176 [Diaporthe amygdali]|uniref:uncharacterized protein n=1 Tax=Phomopsis amygdali TaxID=1214568 RepID=UPI0022FEEEE3|nr:uncharacterized protein J7T55_003176 [Diaporthe amygdali]KAJ0122661.1 hypothetical protein J7T55_003176 [Diaporthe amygdali]